MQWSRMGFKAEKSRSVVMRRGVVDHVHRFISLAESPVKTFERWYTMELNDVGRMEEIRNNLLRSSRIDGCGLPRKLKIWCLKFGLMP